jgi:hypothetical protein
VLVLVIETGPVGDEDEKEDDEFSNPAHCDRTSARSLPSSCRDPKRLAH